MKIAYIVPSKAYKGPVIVVFEFIKMMQDKGHSCKVFYFDHTPEPMCFDCPTEQISMNTAIDFTQFDVVHSNMMRPDKYVAKYREHSGKVLYVSTIHCYIFSVLTDSYNWIVSQIFGRKWIKSLKSFDRIAVLSNHAKSYYKKWLDEKTLFVIYHSRKLDVSKTLTIEEKNEVLNFKGNSTLIGINANVLKIKGIDFVIKALPELPSHSLFVVGDGAKRKMLEKLAEKLGVANRCYFAGYRKDAYRYLDYYDISAIPSRSEGFSLALIEAAYFSKSTVLSNIPIFKELVNDSQTFMFDLDFPNSIVSAIQDATINQKKNVTLRRNYDDNFSPEIFYNKYITLYIK